jgi:hypothetical protein
MVRRTGEAITDEHAFASSLQSPGGSAAPRATPSPSPEAVLSPASAGPATGGMHHVASEVAFGATTVTSPSPTADATPSSSLASAAGPTVVVAPPGSSGPATARAALLASVTGIGVESPASSAGVSPAASASLTAGSGLNGAAHDDGHVVVPPHIERALASVTSPQMSVSTQSALLSFGRAVGTAMHRAPLPTFFPVFARAGTPAGGTSAPAGGLAVTTGRASVSGRPGGGTPTPRTGGTPTPRGSVTGAAHAFGGRNSIAGGLPVSSLLSPAASAGGEAAGVPAGGVRKVGSRGSMTASGEGGAGAAPLAPSHVDLFVHGHHVTRPRLGTAVDVVSERVAPDHTAHHPSPAAAATLAPVVAAADGPAPEAPAAHTTAVVGGTHSSHAFHPYVHRLPAITDVDETLSSPPLRARGSSAGEPPDATALPPPALPAVAEDKPAGAEDPDTPMLSAAASSHAASPAPAPAPAAPHVDVTAASSKPATTVADGAAIVHHHSHHHSRRHHHHGGASRRHHDTAPHAKRKGRHLEALQLLGVGNPAETVFLWLVAAFGVAVLVLTTVQSVQEAAGTVASTEPAFCRGA